MKIGNWGTPSDKWIRLFEKLRPGEPVPDPCRWPSKIGKLRIRLEIIDLSSDYPNDVGNPMYMRQRLNDDSFCQHASNTLFDKSGQNINMLFRSVFHAGNH
jgi:hypothetical protein